MSILLGSGVTGNGSPEELPTDIALLNRASCIAFVDFNDLYWKLRNDIDDEGRLLSFTDRKGNAFTATISYALNQYGQFTDFGSTQKGLSLGASRGTFVSSSTLIPSSGSYTLMALFQQTTGADGYPFASNDTSNWVASGFLSTNALRVGWGSVVTFDPASSTNAGAVSSLILSWDAANGRLRTFLNNVEKDDRATTAPTITDRKLMVGGRANSGSVTGVVDGVLNSVLLFSEAGDNGSAFITALQDYGTARGI